MTVTGVLLALASAVDARTTIISGADTKHFWPLVQLLKSIEEHEPGARILVYDLGFNQLQRDNIEHGFDAVTVRRFKFSDYPKHFNIRVNAGEYAWKPAIIHNVLEEFKGVVIWLDAGCKLANNLDKFKQSVVEHGMHSPRSPGEVSKWTHPSTLQYFEVGTNSKDVLNYRILSAGLFGANYDHPGIRDLVKEWSDCAKLKECIAPEGRCASRIRHQFYPKCMHMTGSSRKNHRQDQSALSIIAAKFGYLEYISIRDPDYNKMLMHHQGKTAPVEELGTCI
jgi:hypothetical protein